MKSTEGDLQTENETLHRRLEEVEETLHAVFEQSYVGIAETDSKGCFIRVNGRFCEIAGFTRAELLAGMCWRDIIHPEDLPDYHQSFGCAATEGISFQIEMRCLRKDGSIVWVHNSVSTIMDRGGKLRSLTSMATDVSERKRVDEERDKFVSDRKKAEHMPVANRQRFASIVEAAMDAIITIDSRHLIAQFNAAAEKVFGLPAAQAIGSPINRFIPERFRHAHTAHIKAFGSSGLTSRSTGHFAILSALRANGEEFPIEASISQTESDGEKWFTVILRDISERMRSEADLRERVALQEQLTKIAATVPGVICSFRLRPDGTAGMPYASPAFEAVYGLRREEVAEDFTPVFERIHLEDIGHVHATIAESARTMIPWRGTFRYRHPSKGEIWIEGHSMPQREPDGSIFWHGYIQDITERKQQEQEIALLNQRLKHRIEEMQTVFETAPIGLAIADDPEGLHIRGNPANERLLGLPPGAELSWRAPQSDKIHFFRDGRELSVDELPMQRAVRGETISGLIMEMVRPDGQKSTLIANAAPLFDEQGHPRGAVGAFLEITALKRAVEKLRESEHFKQAVLDALPASIAVLDHQGVICSVNQPWLSFAAENGEADASKIGAGVNYLDACRHTMSDSNGHAEAAFKGIDAVLHGEKTYFELVYPCHSPEMERWFLMQVVQPSDKVGGAIVIHLDISERKRAQAEIERHVHDLLAANQELARFNRAAVGRELRMIELKKQVNELCALAGQSPRYRVDFDLPSPPASIE